MIVKRSWRLLRADITRPGCRCEQSSLQCHGRWLGRRGGGAGERTVEKILARSAALAGRSANGEPGVGPCAPYAPPLEAQAGWLRASIAALSLLPPPSTRSARMPVQRGRGGAAAPSLGFRGGHRGGRAVLEVGMAQLDPSVVCGRDLGVGGTRGQAQRRVGVRRHHRRAAARYMRAVAAGVSAEGWGETAAGRLRPPPHSRGARRPGLTRLSRSVTQHTGAAA